METKLNLMKMIYMRKLKMNESLEIKLVKISETYEEVQKQLSLPNLTNEERVMLSKKFSSLEQVIKKKMR